MHLRWSPERRKRGCCDSNGAQRDPDYSRRTAVVGTLLEDTVSAVHSTIQLEHFFNMQHRVPVF